MRLDPDPSSPAYAENLYDIYSWYRNNNPVHKATTLGRPSVSLFKFDDVCAALTDQRLGSVGISVELIAAIEASGQHELAKLARESGILTVLDNPDHKRIRDVIQKPVRAAMGEQLIDDIRALADELLGNLRTDEPIDIVSEYSVPLSMRVICGVVGLPAEDYPQLKHWTDEFAPIFDSSQMMGGIAGAGKALLEFQQYLIPIIAARRQNPRDDVLTALAVAHYDTQTISDSELVANCLLLLTAGNVTTRHLVGNAVHALVSHPEQLRKLREEPGLMSSAIGEMLRYDSPLQCIGRVAKEPFRVRDTEIDKGTRVRLIIGSANRDADRFERPNELDISRRNNRHVGFGGGMHACLGAHLGTIECKIAMTALLERFDDISFATESWEWIRGHKTRGFTALPVVLRLS